MLIESVEDKLGERLKRNKKSAIARPLTLTDRFSKVS